MYYFLKSVACLLLTISLQHNSIDYREFEIKIDRIDYSIFII